MDFLAEHGYQAHCGTMRPTSRGTVQLASGSALDAPLIDPNFLSTEEDRKDLRQGLRLTVEIMEQSALQEFKRETGRTEEVFFLCNLFKEGFDHFC